MDSTPIGSFGQYWSLSGGSWGLQASLLLLIVLLVLSAYIVLSTLSDQQIGLRAARRMRQEPSIGTSIAALLYGKDKRLKIFQNIAEAGVQAAARYGGRLAERLSFSEWVGGCIERAVGREQRRLEKDIPILPVLGVIAPAVAIFIVLVILSTCVSRYAEITVVQPMTRSAAIARHALRDQYTGGSLNKASPPGGEESRDSSRSHASSAATPPSDRSEPDRAFPLDYNDQMFEIYLWLGQAISVLILGVLVVVSAFGGYFLILARNRSLVGNLREFADELTGFLLTSPLPPERASDGVDDASVFLVT